MIQLHDKTFVPFINAAQIDEAVVKVACQVENDFRDETPVFVAVLNGAFMFASDFMKHYKSNCEISFVKLASYEGTSSTNDVKQLIGLNQDLKGRSVVLIEDIVDTGLSLTFLKHRMEEASPKSIRFATCLYKPDVAKHDFAIDWIGFNIDERYFVGYGLDLKQIFRGLPGIYAVKKNNGES